MFKMNDMELIDNFMKWLMAKCETDQEREMCIKMIFGAIEVELSDERFANLIKYTYALTGKYLHEIAKDK